MKQNYGSGISVTKASGARQQFSEKKLRRSIRRARIPNELENDVIIHVNDILYDGIPTSEIYKHIIEFIGKSKTPYQSAKYTLKRAIMQLGPSGYPFEKFIAAILGRYGYETKANQIVMGNCIEHEIDVIAEKNKKRHMLECKFHNQPGARSDVKVALYTKARFDDVAIQGEQDIVSTDRFHDVWLVTNTKATTEAIKYAKCVGMQIVSWGYPRVGNLRELIEDANLHPITCLTTLSEDQKKHLLSLGFVLCKDILDDKQNTLKNIGLNKEHRKSVRQEISIICKDSREES